MDCVFCRIVEGKIPARIISETGKSIAFMDAFPLAPGHSIIIPKRHHEKIQDIPEDENADLFETVRRAMSRIDELTGATLMAVHNGRQSGQEIPHVHVHLVPRSTSDGAGPIHSMFKNAPQITGDESFALYDRLKCL